MSPVAAGDLAEMINETVDNLQCDMEGGSVTTAGGGADQTSFRQVCSRFATGVAAITASTPDGHEAAFTANSFASVSLDPPLVLVCVGHAVSSALVMERADRVAIHILGSRHEHVARRLATSKLNARERLEGLERGPAVVARPAMLEECVARLTGPVARRVEAGDHTILIIAVEQSEILAPEEDPLVFHRGRLAPFSHAP